MRDTAPGKEGDTGCAGAAGSAPRTAAEGVGLEISLLTLPSRHKSSLNARTVLMAVFPLILTKTGAKVDLACGPRGADPAFERRGRWTWPHEVISGSTHEQCGACPAIPSETQGTSPGDVWGSKAKYKS